MYKYNVYLPHYFGGFQCTTSECKDNCCKQPWDISIDKETFDRFMRLEKAIRVECREKINIISRNPFSAEVVRSENGECTFLDDSGHCTIHLRLGPEYLSGICMCYPRTFCSVEGDIEAFLHLSCEAAAELVLLDQSIMSFEEVVLESEKPLDISYMLDVGEYTAASNAVEAFWKLRTVSIVIVQSRQYDIHLRLKYLGLFIKMIQEQLSSGNDEGISDFADQFLEGLESRLFDELAEQLHGGVDFDIEFVLDIIDEFEKKDFKLLNAYIRDFRAGMGLSAGDRKVSEGFFDKYNMYYEKHLADREYIFENLIVNHIFAAGFPFNYVLQDSVVKNYRELIIKFNLIKTLLVGVCGHDGRSDDKRIVECVSSFLKVFDHRKRIDGTRDETAR